ncbi:MAG TPA: outer membrane protein assembly factor BamA [Verrucomicrobiae bacterium]|nr:outer membrane protein assembly factor BamA [Verrucomicrobiae bacterium]
MKLVFRLFGLWLLLICAQAAWSQMLTPPKVDRVDIQYVGPASVSEQFIRANINLKAGDPYLPTVTEQDIHSLYATGQFYNIRVRADPQPDGGYVVTYIVQANLRITDVKISGNKKLSDSKIRKKITVKVGQALDEQKLFTDVQEIKKLYEKYGYPDTQVKYVFDTFDEATGRASVTFQIVESKKIRVTNVEFIGATNFPQKELRKQIKTRRHWMFSWLTGSGVFKEDQFADDKDALTAFYRSHGYLDFDIKDVKFDYPTPNTMVIKFYVYEGKQYKVGSIKFTDNKVFTDAEIRAGLLYIHDFQHSKAKLGTNNLPMDVGDTFTPDGLEQDRQAIQDFYGSKGYIDYTDPQNPPLANIIRVPNVDTGTMDLNFQLNEGRQSRVEQINIRGNIKTKDKVIRRELAISPGEVFDMVRVKISQQRLEGLDYFEKVQMQPEPMDPPVPGRQNLDVDVQEKDTGKFTMGAGFSSVDSLVGFGEITQGNFDLFHPPYFTGGGQKLRLYVALGTQRQDYELSFIEPWFLNRKLALGVDLYRHQLNFESLNGIYDETRTGARLSLTRGLVPPLFLTRLLGDGDLTAGISYSIEQVGINLNGGWHGWEQQAYSGSPIVPPPVTTVSPNVPQAILEQTGDHVFNRFGATFAYDTRNSNRLPNHGQRTELDPQISVGNSTFYKIEAKTAWFFPGLFKGHVVELDGRAGVAAGLTGGDVPFYDRYYLGGAYSLRGFDYRSVSPRDPNYGNPQYAGMSDEPIGGDSYWCTTLEYSLPILEKDNGPSLRFAMFYDAGAVGASSYSFSDYFDDDAGIGFRLDIPHLGPLRLDYGVPITHDKYNGSGGKFQFTAGYTHLF